MIFIQSDVDQNKCPLAPPFLKTIMSTWLSNSSIGQDSAISAISKAILAIKDPSASRDPTSPVVTNSYSTTAVAVPYSMMSGNTIPTTPNTAISSPTSLPFFSPSLFSSPPHPSWPIIPALNYVPSLSTSPPEPIDSASLSPTAIARLQAEGFGKLPPDYSNQDGGILAPFFSHSNLRNISSFTLHPSLIQPFNPPVPLTSTSISMLSSSPSRGLAPPSPSTSAPSASDQVTPGHPTTTKCFQCKNKFQGNSVTTSCCVCLKLFHKSHLLGSPPTCHSCVSASVSSQTHSLPAPPQPSPSPTHQPGHLPSQLPPPQPRRKLKSQNPPSTPQATEFEFLKSERNLAKAKIVALESDLNSINQLNSILKERIQSVEIINNQRQFDQYFPPTPPPPPPHPHHHQSTSQSTRQANFQSTH